MSSPAKFVYNADSHQYTYPDSDGTIATQEWVVANAEFNPANDETITGDWVFTGDFSVGDSSSGTGFAIDRANEITSIGDWQNGNNGTIISIDDNIGLVGISASDGLELNGYQVATQEWVVENAGFNPANDETITGTWIFDETTTFNGIIHGNDDNWNINEDGSASFGSTPFIYWTEYGQATISPIGMASGLTTSSYTTKVGDISFKNNSTYLDIDDEYNLFSFISTNGPDSYPATKAKIYGNNGSFWFDDGNITSDGSGDLSAITLFVDAFYSDSFQVCTDGYGNFRANTIVKNGGTSSQVLMADGSTSTFPSGLDSAANETITADLWEFTNKVNIGGYNGNNNGFQNTEEFTVIGDWNSEYNSTTLTVDDNAQQVVVSQNAYLIGLGQVGDDAVTAWSLNPNGSVNFDNGAFTSDGNGNITANSIITPSVFYGGYDEWGNLNSYSVSATGFQSQCAFDDPLGYGAAIGTVSLTYSGLTLGVDYSQIGGSNSYIYVTPSGCNLDNGAFTSDGSGNVTLNSISTPNWYIDQYGNFSGNAGYAYTANIAGYLGTWFDDGTYLNSGGNRGISTPYWNIQVNGGVWFDDGDFTSDGSGNVTLNTIYTPNWYIDQYANFSGNATSATSASLIGGIWYDDGTNLNSNGNERGIQTPDWNISQNGAVYFDNGAITSDGSGNIGLNSIVGNGWNIDEYGNFSGKTWDESGIVNSNWTIGSGGVHLDYNGTTTANIDLYNGQVSFDSGTFTSDGSGNVTLKNLTSATIGALNFADDTAAEAGGVPVGGIYNTAGVLKIRLT